MRIPRPRTASAPRSNAAPRRTLGRRRVPVVAALAILLLAGCAPVMTGAMSSESAPVPAPLPGVEVAPDESTSDAPGVDGTTLPAVDPLEQAVVVTGWVSLVADAPVAAADDAAVLAEEHGGTVSSRTESAGSTTQPERATLTLRVPAEAVDDVLDGLRVVGEVRDVDVSEVDVTQQVQELDVRVQSARASVERLTTLLATAADTQTLLDIESQLTTRTAELESLVSQQTALADQVSLSTIDVTIVSPEVDPTVPTTFVDGVAAGWDSLLTAGSALLVAIGAALPWLAVLAVPVVALVVAVRRRRSRMSLGAARPGDETPVVQ